MTIYKPDIRYLALTVLALGLAIMPARAFWQRLGESSAIPFEELIFLLICLGIALWGAYTARSWVELTAAEVTVRGPFSWARSVEHRQLINIELGGRLGKSVALLYHPKLENGLLDLDDANSIFLPVVRNQQELYDRLAAQVPK